MGLVTSHTYNISHAYLSHTPHCKAPYISGSLICVRINQTVTTVMQSQEKLLMTVKVIMPVNVAIIMMIRYNVAQINY